MSDLHQCDRLSLAPHLCDCGKVHIVCSVCDAIRDACLTDTEDYAFLLANVRDAVGDDE